LLLPTSLTSLNLTPFWTYYCRWILRFFRVFSNSKWTKPSLWLSGLSVEICRFWKPLFRLFRYSDSIYSRHANSMSWGRNVLSIYVCVWTRL